MLFLPQVANSQEVVWQYQQYETKEIEGGKFTLNLHFQEEDNIFKGQIVGSGSLTKCELNFKGRGENTTNPLYARAYREDFTFYGRKSTREWTFISFEKRQNVILSQMEKFNKTYSYRVYCETSKYQDRFPIEIPYLLKFYPKK